MTLQTKTLQRQWSDRINTFSTYDQNWMDTARKFERLSDDELMELLWIDSYTQTSDGAFFLAMWRLFNL